jgi:chromosome partitioning protein
MKKFVWANKKGGVGKTTGSSNLAGAFAQAGYRVLVIDMDPQANLTYVFLSDRTPSVSVYDLMTDADNAMPIRDVIVPTQVKGVDILPSHKVAMDGAERELSGVIGEQVLLASRLRELPQDAYDFVVIDSPPNLGILTVNAITSADEVIIPVRPGVFALQGIEDLFNIIRLVQTRLNRPDLKVAGFVINEVDQTNVARDVHTELRGHFGNAVFETQIPRNISLEEAHSRTGTVFQHAPKSKGAQAYMDLVQEIIKHG